MERASGLAKAELAVGKEAEAKKCPRCDSTNTKFCYYNNYNLTQPRHFCKSCRRYWTVGGTLRNIPVGGGTRKSSRRVKPKTSAGPETHHEVVISEHEFPVMGSFLHDEIPVDGLVDDAGTFCSLPFSGGCFNEPFGVLGWPSGEASSHISGFEEVGIGNLGAEEVWHRVGGEGLDGDCWGGNGMADSVIPAPGQSTR